LLADMSLGLYRDHVVYFTILDFWFQSWPVGTGPTAQGPFHAEGSLKVGALSWLTDVQER